MLQAAQAPVVIAGSGVWYADAGEALRGFVERAGIPVFTGNSGRGIISDTHPLCFQSSLVIRPGAAFFTLASADLILFLGSRLSLFYLFGDIFRKDASSSRRTSRRRRSAGTAPWTWASSATSAPCWRS